MEFGIGCRVLIIGLAVCPMAPFLILIKNVYDYTKQGIL